ncbi:hypothetical protein AB685_20580 [Bacillus sp. LL01]|uniref:hypothetical protein n=1 Tax=Bacillus sp. LL01 TaxID=1665556 RepID=UPI00064D1F24|nr:hypothetical protein [Bacillus sp. LL01]KMJ56664.1 hypothetical protein AB685_20580 [Bacillus sp. LL01]
MKKTVFILLLAIILGACGLQKERVNGAVDNESIGKEPPVLLVRSNNSEVAAVLGEYSWSFDNGDGTATTVSVDSDIPPRIVRNQTTPFTTELDTEIQLDFAEPPQEIKVHIWNNSQMEREVDVEGSTFNTDEKGYILYEIIATWDQGSVHYAVKLNVQ